MLSSTNSSNRMFTKKKEKRRKENSKRREREKEGRNKTDFLSFPFFCSLPSPPALVVTRHNRFAAWFKIQPTVCGEFSLGQLVVYWKRYILCSLLLLSLLFSCCFSSFPVSFLTPFFLSLTPLLLFCLSLCFKARSRRFRCTFHRHEDSPPSRQDHQALLLRRC